MTERDGNSDDESACARPGRYANYFKVGHNAFELVLEFGEKFGDTSAAQLHTRIVTNPVYAQALLSTLSDSLRQYQSQFGDVASLGADQRP
jgi:hypothetical protein